jgi:nitrite reductase/ring-hydroxylating ferredoxin subunit
VIPLALLVLSAGAVIGVALAVAWPTPANVRQVTHGPRWVNLTAADDLTVNEPVRFADERLYLVKQPSGEILALSQTSTHLGCTVPWNPDFEFNGTTGWFRDPCHGATWDTSGARVAGPAPRDLDRYEVRVEEGRVQVDLKHLILGPPGTTLAPANYQQR